MYSTHSHANYPYHRCGQANTTSEQGARPTTAFETKLRTPYVEQYHLTVQHELGSKTTVEAAYVGSKGTHLYTTSNLNQATATADPTALSAPRRPFPYVDSYIGFRSRECP